MSHSMEPPPLSVDNPALENAHHFVGELALDGSIGSLKADPFLNTNATSSPINGNRIANRCGTESSSTDLSDTTSDDDYDTLKMDPSAMVTGGRGGGFLAREDQTWNEKYPEKHYKGASEDSVDENRRERRQSIPVKLERTDKAGRYLLTSDDPELRELLSIYTERASGDGKKRRAKFSDLIFTRQFTTFDRQNPASAASPFHGFFTLFWLGVFMSILKVAGENWRTYGSAFGKNEILYMMFSREVVALGATDGIMCGGTVMGLLLQKTIAQGWIRWNGAGWVMQHIWQAFYLGVIIGWTIYRDWQWTHTVFIVLHCMVMLMKQHSYAFYNGHCELSVGPPPHEDEQCPDIRCSVSDVYLHRKALLIKSRHLRELEDPGTSPTVTATGSLSVADLSSANGSTHRRLSASRKNSNDLRQEKAELSKVASAIDSGVPLNSEQLSSFVKLVDWEIEALTTELNGKCSTSGNHYPKNLTLKNWAEFVVLPTLVYELEYPRQERTNWSYVAEKTLATFGIVGVMIVVSQAYIYPVVMRTMEMRDQGWTLKQRLQEFPWILSDLLFPFTMEYLLAFYVIWECILNVLAELTQFADRGFYADWWNATSWDQYARDWNRPVHNFLLRHVYHSSISTFRVSRKSATTITFLLNDAASASDVESNQVFEREDNFRKSCLLVGHLHWAELAL
ncbi:MAG: acyl-CoA/sterol acyltransferase [Geoglossum simile]|nr:MAG: acyl-CoA/sterol acyltransferase [Geoglossum simile]